MSIHWGLYKKFKLCCHYLEPTFGWQERESKTCSRFLLSPIESVQIAEIIYRGRSLSEHPSIYDVKGFCYFVKRIGYLDKQRLVLCGCQIIFIFSHKLYFYRGRSHLLWLLCHHKTTHRNSYPAYYLR